MRASRKCGLAAATVSLSSSVLMRQTKMWAAQGSSQQPPTKLSEVASGVEHCGVFNEFRCPP
eukprot:2578314-Amphidinium_carterae.1